MIYFPETVEDIPLQAGEIRAGGTELHDRRLQGLSAGPIIDLQNVSALQHITLSADQRSHIGAMVTLEQLRQQPWLARRYYGLARAVSQIATPQIRRVATVGGNLLQRNRCWYYRQKEFDCYKKGGHSCPARQGNHLYGICFDLGPCIAPHPSTLGVALLAYDATVHTLHQSRLSIEQLLGDGRTADCDHQLPAYDVLCEIELPSPTLEVSGYIRAADRAFAAWPLVEMVVRIQGDQYISRACIAVGGIANVPIRLTLVEDFLRGQPFTQTVFAQAAELATTTATPLPSTSYKVVLLKNCLKSLLSEVCADKIPA
jgi:Aerobic-type carbon monoxide dehydrogenase, middle subunit CoxM/CutM homologs